MRVLNATTASSPWIKKPKMSVKSHTAPSFGFDVVLKTAVFVAIE